MLSPNKTNYILNTFHFNHILFWSHFILIKLQKEHIPKRAHSRKGTFQKGHIFNDHIRFWSYSKKNIFQKQHILKRAYSEKGTFWSLFISVTFQKGHITFWERVLVNFSNISITLLYLVSHESWGGACHSRSLVCARVLLPLAWEWAALKTPGWQGLTWLFFQIRQSLMTAAGPNECVFVDLEGNACVHYGKIEHSFSNIFSFTIAAF